MACFGCICLEKENWIWFVRVFLDPKNICMHKPCINVGSRAGDLFVEMWHKHAQTH